MLRLTIFCFTFFSLALKLSGQVSDCPNISYNLDSPPVCDPMDNVFSQPIKLSFNEINGNLMINDSSIQIFANQLTFDFQSLSDSKEDTITIYFEDDPTCREIFVLKAPDNCCPFDLNMDSIYVGCIGVPIKIGAEKKNLIFNWLDSNGRFIADTDSVILSNAGRYTLVAKTLTGCEKRATFDVTFKNKPSLVLPPAHSVCETFGDEIPIQTDGNTFQWALNGVAIDTAKTSRILPSVSGIYSVIVSYFNSCPVEGSTTVTMKNAVKPILGEDMKVCESEKRVLNVAQTGSAAWYKDDILLPNEFLKSLTVTQSGSYRVRLTGSNNCFNEDTIQVLIVPKPFLELGNGFGLCPDDSTVLQASADASSLLWRKDGDMLAGTGLALKIYSGGLYSATAISEVLATCSQTDTIVINNLTKPNILPPVGFQDTIFLCPIEQGRLILPSQAGLKYVWHINGVQLSNENVVSFDTTGVLSYLVTNSSSCSVKDTTIVVRTDKPIISFTNKIESLCEGDSLRLHFKSGFPNSIFLNNVLLQKSIGGFFNAKKEGTYILSGSAIYNGKECKEMDTMVLQVFDQPIFDLGKNDSICNTFTLKPDRQYTGLQYMWSMDQRPIDSIGQTIEVNKSGLYLLEIFSNEGCSFKDSVRIDLFPEVTITSAFDSIKTCEDSPIKLILTTQNAQKFKWFYEGIALPDVQLPELIVTKTGTYKLNASNEKCESNKSIKVNFLKPLPINLGRDTILCDGQMIKLSGPIGAKNYIWSTMDSTSGIEVKSSATNLSINLTVLSQDGCPTKDTILIQSASAIKLKVKEVTKPICLLDTKNITIQGAKKITWSSERNDFTILNDTSISVFLDDDKMIRAMASNLCGSDTLDITLMPIRVPSVLITSDTCIYEGKTATLLLQKGYKYQWKEHPSIKSILTNNSITVTPDITTLYKVTTLDTTGCKRIDSIEVCVVELDKDKFVPITVITPNGDGKNDVLRFELLDLIPQNRLVIYNRWGNIVFEKNNYQSDDELFDGTKNGENLPTDVYYYVLTFHDKIYKETLTIVRN